MLLRQSLKTSADVVKLVHFVQDSFKSHGCAPFTGAKEKKHSDGLLSSEDLKEEKVVTTPVKSISRPFVVSRGERHLEVNYELASAPAKSTKPNVLNLFMKNLTRDRVVPIVSARVS
jgi:hypothetical protein